MFRGRSYRYTAVYGMAEETVRYTVEREVIYYFYTYVIRGKTKLTRGKPSLSHNPVFRRVAKLMSRLPIHKTRQQDNNASTRRERKH